MNIGIVFPQIEFGNDTAAIRDYVQTAEDLGYTHVLAYDHILGANPDRPEPWQGPYTYKDPFHEPFLLFSYMAALTQTIEFVTGILILPQRETALVAKQAAELDVLSNGRFRLGIGNGWNKVEYLAQNQDFHSRGKRIEEQVDVLRQLWQNDLVTYEGQFHHIPDAGLNPLPVQQPIPIWFGGHADAVLQRLGRIGDGWFPNYKTAQECQPSLDKLDEFLAKNGRSRTDIGIEPRIHFGDGNPDTWQQLRSDWQTAGATHITLNTMYLGFDTPEKHIQAMRQFAETLL